MRVHAIQSQQVVVHRVFHRCGGVFTDVQSQQQRQAGPPVAEGRLLHVGDEGVQTVVVKTQAVDQRIGLLQAEHARLGVARLGFRRDGAHLNKTKPHAGQAVYAVRVFVQASGQAHPVGKLQACQFHLVFHPAGAVRQGQRRALGARQRSQGQLVGGFWIQTKQKWAGECVRQQGHRIICVVIRDIVAKPCQRPTQISHDTRRTQNPGRPGRPELC